jgi:predicted GNAT family acetyltransferase
MKAQTIQSAQDFLDIAGDDLLADKIKHGLSFGIVERLIENPYLYGSDDPWFVVTENLGKICATAMRTPPHRAILTHHSGDVESVAAELAQAIREIEPVISGVVGTKQIADAFTQKWLASSGQQVTDVMAQRIYQLTELIEPKWAGGYFRQANLDDEEIILAWIKAFHEEAVGDIFSASHYERYRERILNGEIYLWDNAGPTSMAMKTRPMQSSITIGGVYTPPEKRNHGYASSCVAALCRELLTEYRFCVLYTDLSNPTSNAIYKKMGFKEYCDSVQYTYSE